MTPCAETDPAPGEDPRFSIEVWIAGPEEMLPQPVIGLMKRFGDVGSACSEGPGRLYRVNARLAEGFEIGNCGDYSCGHAPISLSCRSAALERSFPPFVLVENLLTGRHDSVGVHP